MNLLFENLSGRELLCLSTPRLTGTHTFIEQESVVEQHCSSTTRFQILHFFMRHVVTTVYVASPVLTGTCCRRPRERKIKRMDLAVLSPFRKKEHLLRNSCSAITKRRLRRQSDSMSLRASLRRGTEMRPRVALGT